MALSSFSDISDFSHPIDMIEEMAVSSDWDFDRLDDNQIAMAIQGQWRTYSITTAWSAYDETLRTVCTFELEPPEEKLPVLYEGINLINDQCWSGAFTYWNEMRLMVYRYGLLLAGVEAPTQEQISTMIQATVLSSERYYPALQLLIWGDRTPEEAIQAAIAEAYGRA